MDNQLNEHELEFNIRNQMNALAIFDIPEGRQLQLIDEYYKTQGQQPDNELLVKLAFIQANNKKFKAFLENQSRFKSERLDIVRQVTLEPQLTHRYPDAHTTGH